MDAITQQIIRLTQKVSSNRRCSIQSCLIVIGKWVDLEGLGNIVKSV